MRPFLIMATCVTLLVSACSSATPAATATSAPLAATTAAPAATTTTLATTTEATTTTDAATTTTTTTVPAGLRIAVAGDTGTRSVTQYEVAARMASGEGDGEYDALLLLGDLIYPDGEFALLDEAILEPYADTLDGETLLLPVIGNHDARSGDEHKIMAALGYESTWYAERFGSVLIVVLDSTRPGDPDQARWLDETLVQADARWTIVALHHPPYSVGSHGSSLETQQAFGDTFDLHGVDLVLSGHDHDYQRSVPLNDVIYVVSGAGAKLRDAGSGDFMVVSKSTLHHLVLDITDDTIHGTAIGASGIIDEFTIEWEASNRA